MTSAEGNEIPVELEQILKDNTGLKLVENGRIKCLLTGHEMVCRKHVIEQHIEGKKYLRMSKGINKQFSLIAHEPHLVPSIKKGHEHQLFCTLTLRHVNKIPQHIERHVNGKKFLRAKARWEDCQKSGEKFVPTPMLNRQNKDFVAKEDAEGTNEVLDGDISEADSFSDLYPEKYFEKLRLSSSDEENAMKVAKPKLKKKKKLRKTVNSSTSKKKPMINKRKIASKESLVAKKQCLEKPKSKKSKLKPNLIVNGI
ncbi:unnamed protein product [Clavelina lepadiformis]|uniref:Surfeit locus protein 2 n=1 Tax=Clavelina lepadiformis TaxID=159417 RepID=A0ABP0GG33_CLALP